MKNPEFNDIDLEYRLLLEEVAFLRSHIVQETESRIRRLSSQYGEQDFAYLSVHNLLHYLALREQDLRSLQQRLARRGLYSLERVESHVLASIDEILRVLAGLCQERLLESNSPSLLSFDVGHELLITHTLTLFGPPQCNRLARIMVTMPEEIAVSEGLARSFLRSGMDCARIQCAKGDPSIWRNMIHNLQNAQKSVRRDCRIMMELSGNQIRTGKIADKPAVTRLRPQPGSKGKDVVLVLLVPDCPESQGIAEETGLCRLTVDPACIESFRADDRLFFADLDGRERYLLIDRPLEEGGWIARCNKKARIGPETAMRLMRQEKDRWNSVLKRDMYLGGHRIRPMKIHLTLGDFLQLTGPEYLGQPAQFDAEGKRIESARIGISTPDIFSQLVVGQSLSMGDGELGGTVVESGSETVLIKITQAPPEGFRVQGDRRIHFPGIDLHLDPFTSKDLKDLDYIAQHADMVGVSSVETRSDMQQLLAELARRDAGQMGIVLRVETEQALRHLPEILLTAMGKHPVAILVASGDLAVAIGSERLAEIYEDVLRLAEAGHMPVIWSSQALDSLTRASMVSYPETAEVAMSVRSECVLLDNGPLVEQAIRALDITLLQMQEYQQKSLGKLHILQWVDQ